MEGLCLIVLPVFLGHLLGSFAGLRVWLAVKGTPGIVAKSHIETAGTTLLGDGDSIIERIARVVVGGFLIPFLVGLIIMQVRPWESQLNFIFGCALILPLGEAMYSCIHDLAGFGQTLHRNPDGVLRLDPGYYPANGPRTPLRSLGRFMVGFAFPAVTLYYNIDIGASFLLFVIVYALQSTHSRKWVFMQDVISTAVELYVLFLCCIAGGLLIHRFFGKKPVKEAMRAILLLGGDHVYYWIKILLATAPPTSIFSTSLRIDFANHAAREDLTNALMDLVPLEVALVRTRRWKSEHLTTGVVIPASLPFTFESPYFTCTLLAWLFANMGVMFLLACGWLSDFGMDAVHFAHTFYVLVCASPMVLLSLFMVALVRGEVERVWMYREVWQ